MNWENLGSEEGGRGTEGEEKGGEGKEDDKEGEGERMNGCMDAW